MAAFLFCSAVIAGGLATDAASGFVAVATEGIELFPGKDNKLEVVVIISTKKIILISCK